MNLFKDLVGAAGAVAIAWALGTGLAASGGPSGGISGGQPRDQAPRAQVVARQHVAPPALAYGSDSAEELVLETLRTARKAVNLSAYTFTSPNVVRGLLEAKKRGALVRVVVDGRGNGGKSNVAALNILVNAGIEVRLVDAYAIHHDKFMVIDGELIQTGSFNYSQAAAQRNSENVLVVRDAATASRYLAHWQRRWDGGRPWMSSY